MEKFRFHSARKQLVIFFSWEYESCTPLQKKISEKIFGIICRQLLCSKIGFLRTSKLLNLKHLFKCYDSAPFSWEKNLSGAISLMLLFSRYWKKLARSWNLSIFLLEIKDIFSNYPKVAMYSVSLSSCIIVFICMEVAIEWHCGKYFF